MRKVVVGVLVLSLACAGCLATEGEPADAAEQIGEAQEPLAPIVIALLGAAVGAAATAGAAVYLAQRLPARRPRGAAPTSPPLTRPAQSERRLPLVEWASIDLGNMQGNSAPQNRHRPRWTIWGT